MAKNTRTCQWISLKEALAAFAENVSGHQGSEHIKPLHWYVACRLVLEGGFHPDDITPRPPFSVAPRGAKYFLIHSPETGSSGERTILGGLKTKDVDVVVAKQGIGPVIAVSMKGTLNAFRNLTNRMEEAVGDCTNLHIAYPALVYGFLQVLRANREAPGSSSRIRAARRRNHLTERGLAPSLLTRLHGPAWINTDTAPGACGRRPGGR